MKNKQNLRSYIQLDTKIKKKHCDAKYKTDRVINISFSVDKNNDYFMYYYI